MFIGHFALSFAAKPALPRVGLAVLCAAAAFADLLWPLLLTLGVEQVRIDPGNTAVTPLDFVSYPYSHSLITLMVWGVLFGLAYRAVTRQNGHAVVILAALVVSHWVLDFVTHRPDMPLYPGGEKFGLGLWNSVAATAAIEVSMFAIGVWMYARATRPTNRMGTWAFVSFIVFLLIAYVANLFSTPPPSVPILIVSAGIGTAILLLWAWWADRYRIPRSA